MRIRESTAFVRIVLLTVTFLCGCGTDTPPEADEVLVETLAGGGMYVRSPAAGAWRLAGLEPWRVVEDLRIGVFDGDDRYVFGSVRNVIPDAIGRIWVLDDLSYNLRLFDSGGNFVRSVGGRGAGPGEFGSNSCAFPGPDGEIWVESSRRWARFDSSGMFLKQHIVTSNVGCGIRRWTPHGELVLVNAGLPQVMGGTGDVSFVAHRLDVDSGELVAGDTFPGPLVPLPQSIDWVDAEGRLRAQSLIPLTHRPWYVLGPDGEFFITDGDGRYVIRQQTLQGDTLLIMERRHEPIAVADSTRDRLIREMQREDLTAQPSLSPNMVPRVYPPFDQVYIGTDGLLWVRRQLEGGILGLDVFSPDGRYLGESAELPADFEHMSIYHVTHTHMYGRIRDEFGINYVVRLAIHRPGGPAS